MSVKYAYEYGKRWDAKTPRRDIGYRIDGLHVGQSKSEIVSEIESALATAGPEFTAKIRRECIAYALLRHRRNLDLYLRIARGA